MTKLLITIALCLVAFATRAQDDLLNLLGKDSTVEYTNASFKTTRVINGHSLESTAPGVLDVRINHRFGLISSGAVNAFGLDGPATIRIGFDYGISSRLMVGIGRSNFQKTVDGLVKYKVLRQCDQGCRMPLTLAVVASMSVNTQREQDLPWYSADRTDFYTNRISYNFQAIIGRKFSESISFQIMPGLVHRNLVSTESDKNDLLNIGGAGRCKLTKRLAINAEYFYVLPDQGARSQYQNSLSVGFDIETGGHVFQMFFTNSTGMFERSYIAETTNDFFKGDILYGFNISRVFTIHDPKKRAREKEEGGKKQ